MATQPGPFRDDAVDIELSGTRLLVLNGTLVVMAHWAFEHPAAKALSSKVDRDAASALSDEFGELTRAHFEAHGVWRGESPWTTELLERRAGTTSRFALQRSQIEMAILALRTAATEFSDRWWEYLIVAPGGLDLLDVRPDTLVHCSDYLEACLRSQHGKI